MRLTEDRVALEFESKIHLLGHRTKTSRAGEPPYYVLTGGKEGYEIEFVRGDGVRERISEPMALRDMHFLLEGIGIGERLAVKRAVAVLTSTEDDGR